METVEIEQLDERDIEFADIISKHGFTGNESKVLVCIKSLVSVTPKSIMQCTNLNQSVVSVAVNGLMNKGYVKAEKEVKEEGSGKGRPSMIYSLNKPIHGIIDDIEQNAMQQIDTTNESIERLKELSLDTVSREDTE